MTNFQKIGITVVATIALQLSLVRASNSQTWSSYWADQSKRFAGVKVRGANPTDNHAMAEGFWQSITTRGQGAMAYICAAPESGYKVNFVLANPKRRAFEPNMSATPASVELVNGTNVLCAEQQGDYWIITPQESEKDNLISFFSTKTKKTYYYEKVKSKNTEWQPLIQGETDVVMYKSPGYIENNYIAAMLFNDMYASGTKYNAPLPTAPVIDALDLEGNNSDADTATSNGSGSESGHVGHRLHIQQLKDAGSWFCTNRKCKGRTYWIGGNTVDRQPAPGKTRATRNWPHETKCFVCKTARPKNAPVIKEVTERFAEKRYKNKIKTATV